jgi:hypothetical protein
LRSRTTERGSDRALSYSQTNKPTGDICL